MFDDDFIAALSDDPTEAAKEICDEFMTLHNEKWGSQPSKYDEYVSSYALLDAYIEENNLEHTLPELGINRNENVSNIINSFSIIQSALDKELTENVVEHLKNKYRSKFKNTFAYEFSEGDISRIQELINELRENISEYKGFEENHRQRLLRRLEKLQSELHKRVSDLDRFWGLVGDAGVVLGKFGDDAKPFVDIVREIADIIWRTQSRAEELPSGTKPPLLTQDDNNS